MHLLCLLECSAAAIVTDVRDIGEQLLLVPGGTSAKHVLLLSLLCFPYALSLRAYWFLALSPFHAFVAPLLTFYLHVSYSGNSGSKLRYYAGLRSQVQDE